MKKAKTKILVPVSRRKRVAKRCMIASVILPPAIIAIMVLTVAFGIYAKNHDASVASYPVMRSPMRPDRLLVFAPHPDDETLGAAALMRQARLNGCDVNLVVCTNGDGFRVGVARSFHLLRVGASDFKRYGYMRQGETRTAMSILGVQPSHITFLGYPDRGLMPMWTTNWSPTHPFKSPFTQSDHCPYTDSPDPHAPYCGAAILSDIKNQIVMDRPTDVFVTHPSDDHPDHAAASVFVKTALDELRESGIPWAQHIRLHYYIVHRGDWPIPQGLSEDTALPAPEQMANLDTRWEQLPLSTRDRQRKYAAIQRYTSQVAVTARFMYSFDRKNELFGMMNPTTANSIPRVPNGAVLLDRLHSHWPSMPPFIMDPVGDSVPRAFQQGGDVKAVYACQDDDAFYVRAEMRSSLESQIAYNLIVRTVPMFGAPPHAVSVTTRPGIQFAVQKAPGTPGVTYSWHGKYMDFMIPRALVIGPVHGFDALYLQASTRIAGMTLDKTGFRGAPLSGLLEASAKR